MARRFRRFLSQTDDVLEFVLTAAFRGLWRRRGKMGIGLTALLTIILFSRWSGVSVNPWSITGTTSAVASADASLVDASIDDLMTPDDPEFDELMTPDDPEFDELNLDLIESVGSDEQPLIWAAVQPCSGLDGNCAFITLGESREMFKIWPGRLIPSEADPQLVIMDVNQEGVRALALGTWDRRIESRLWDRSEEINETPVTVVAIAGENPIYVAVIEYKNVTYIVQPGTQIPMAGSADYTVVDVTADKVSFRGRTPDDSFVSWLPGLDL